jgi:hypothetical protein
VQDLAEGRGAPSFAVQDTAELAPTESVREGLSFYQSQRGLSAEHADCGEVPGVLPAAASRWAVHWAANPDLGFMIDSKNLFIGQYDKLFEEYWLSPISYLSPYRG